MSSAPLRVALVALNVPGYSSLALGYLRASAQARKDLQGRVAFQTLDLDVSVDPWWVAYRVIDLEPDVVAVSVSCWSARLVYEMCRVLRSVRPEVTIVVGGPEVSPVAEDVLAANPAISAVVRGEGEETFGELLYALTRSRPIWRVDGVTARRDGEVVSAPDRPLIGDLDSIPSPYLSGVAQAADGIAYIEGYRGCPHKCAYCFEGKGYGRIRHFSQARVKAEIDHIANSPGVRSFTFVDPVFNLTDERLEWLADALEPHAACGMRLHTVEVDIERIGPVQAAQLRRAGVAFVESGPQTIGKRALGICRRPFDRERFAQGVAALKAEGIDVECDLIIGLPGDAIEDVVAGLDFIVGLEPGKLQPSTLHVLPGTELWSRAAELGLEYDSEPPHGAIATREMCFADLRRAEILGQAVAAECAARL